MQGAALPAKLKVLVIDDDESVRKLLDRYLTRNGFSVEVAKDGLEMYQCFQSFAPDILLLDLELPDLHGLTLARDIREKHPDVGIIIVSGTGTDVDKIVSLESNADDFVDKPIDPRLLIARIRSVGRRVLPAETTGDHPKGEMACFDRYRLNLTSHQLFDEHRSEIPLTGHEYQLLEILVKNPNRVMSRDKIIEAVSDYTYIASDRSIDGLVSKIRKKLGTDVTRKALIKTMRGYGYMMTANVKIETMVA